MLRLSRKLVLSLAISLSLTAGLAACASQAAPQQAAETTQATDAAEVSAAVAPGSYEIEVTTDSSMFRSAHCTLEVTDTGAMVAHLALPGEGFSRLFFGTAEEAAAAPDDEIYDYHQGDDGLYTFDLPVEALDEETPIAAYGQRRDQWYDHLITFGSPQQ